MKLSFITIFALIPFSRTLSAHNVHESAAQNNFLKPEIEALKNSLHDTAFSYEDTLILFSISSYFLDSLKKARRKARNEGKAVLAGLYEAIKAANKKAQENRGLKESSHDKYGPEFVHKFLELKEKYGVKVVMYLVQKYGPRILNIIFEKGPNYFEESSKR